MLGRLASSDRRRSFPRLDARHRRTGRVDPLGRYAVAARAAALIAALYVETGGVYYGLPDVDPWDEARDARRYEGPWPVVAHPPCARWCRLAPLNASMHGHAIGDDGGCFEAALRAVRAFGGVLEHPAYSYAWQAFGLPTPTRGAWTSTLFDDGWVTEVSQSAYGHPTRKRTWLYCVGSTLGAMRWWEPEVSATVSDLGPGNSRRRGAEWVPGIQYAAASATPLAFRDALLSLVKDEEHEPANGSE